MSTYISFKVKIFFAGLLCRTGISSTGLTGRGWREPAPGIENGVVLPSEEGLFGRAASSIV